MLNQQHSLELIDETNKIFECSVCKVRGKIGDFYMECKTEDDNKVNSSPFDFIFSDFKSTLTEGDMGPIDGI